MKKILLFLLIVSSSFVFGQEFSITGKLRPRAEYKDYLAGSSRDPIFLTTQQTRLALSYTNLAQHFKTRISFQDSRVLGNSDQQATSDNGSFNVYEAWAEILFTDKLSIQVGRQEIFYDDERILGKNIFSQAGRVHDAAFVKYEGDWKIHLGAAFNTNSSNVKQSYDVLYDLNNYKNMQLLHIGRKWDKVKVGALFFNNGLEYQEDPNDESTAKIIYNQTIGGDIAWKILPNLTFQNIAYAQIGYDHENRKLNARNLKSIIEYWPIHKKLSITAGFDYFSGTPKGLAETENRSFTPIYGAALEHLGMAGLYFLRYSQGEFTENQGVVKYLTQIDFRYKKLRIWSRSFVYNSEFTPYNGTEELDKYLGLEQQFFVFYKYNKHITFTGIVGLFNMSDNTKKGYGLQDYESWQQWYIFDITIRPTFFYKKWDK